MLIKYSLIFVLLFAPIAHAELLTLKDFESDQSEFKTLVFMSPECPCSHSHVAHLNELAESYPDVKFYGVISEPPGPEDQKSVETYFSKERFKFPIISDPSQKLVKQYKALKTPHVSLLRKKGDAYDVIYEGGVTDQKEFEPTGTQFLSKNLKALKTGEKLAYKNGRSLGCYIRRL